MFQLSCFRPSYFDIWLSFVPHMSKACPREIRINLLKKTYNAETKQKFAEPVVDVSSSWFILVKHFFFFPKWRYQSIFCEIEK